MARLPIPGGDTGNWGDILNNYLLQTHKPDGTIKDNIVTANALAPNSVTVSAIADGSITSAQMADEAIQETQLSVGVQAKLNTPASIADDSITKAKLVGTIQDSLDKADNAVQTEELAPAITAVINVFPVRFSAPTAVIGVTPTDYAYASRTLVGARMRVSSAPVGSALIAAIQHWDGYTWTTLGTLIVADGSLIEATATFSQAQAIGNLVRLNVTSVGSSSAATGVAVDIQVSS